MTRKYESLDLPVLLSLHSMVRKLTVLYGSINGAHRNDLDVHLLLPAADHPGVYVLDELVFVDAYPAITMIKATWLEDRREQETVVLSSHYPAWFAQLPPPPFEVLPLAVCAGQDGGTTLLTHLLLGTVPLRFGDGKYFIAAGPLAGRRIKHLDDDVPAAWFPEALL